MVAFLEKPTESEGFEQMVDFLSAHTLRYALTVNPTIYDSYIEQFWSTAMAKTINGDAHIHVWVDGKEIIITESSVRKDLRLADREGVNCLPNSTIFENLELMSSKTTAWNEFSSTMASVIICLATNQKFNFSKLIFDSMIRNLDNSSGKFLMYPRKPKRKNTRVPQPSGSTKHVTDEAIYKKLDDRLARAANTASSLEAEQDSGGGPRCQEAMRDTIAQTWFENVSKLSNDSLLARGNTLQSNEDRMKLNELMKLCTNLQSKVLDLEKIKTTQTLEITSLKRRVKKLENKQRSRTHKLKRLYKVGLTARVDSSEDDQSLGEDASKQGRKINKIDADEDITLVNDQDDAKMFDVNDLHSEEVSAAGEVNATSIATTVSAATTNEITLAQALVEIKTSKPKAKGVVIQEPKPVKPKKKDQIKLDEEATLKLQAEFDE
nr:xylulose kinase-1 [Tanacetum cinerariifolium]